MLAMCHLPKYKPQAKNYLKPVPVYTAEQKKAIEAFYQAEIEKAKQESVRHRES